MKRISIILFVLTIVGQLFFFSCRKPYPACDVENPLKDLPWLVEFIDRTEKGEVLGPVRIYQCTYKDGACFLLEICADCNDGGYSVRNCEGETLCFIGGYSGGSCGENNVDFDNKKLVWKSKKNK